MLILRKRNRDVIQVFFKLVSSLEGISVEVCEGMRSQISQRGVTFDRELCVCGLCKMSLVISCVFRSLLRGNASLGGDTKRQRSFIKDLRLCALLQNRHYS